MLPPHLELLHLMEEISEAGYHAAWLSKLEYELWRIVEDGAPTHFGYKEVDEALSRGFAPFGSRLPVGGRGAKSSAASPFWCRSMLGRPRSWPEREDAELGELHTLRK
jgi:hypothetical protein